jgi:hypothetical protein
LNAYVASKMVHFADKSIRINAVLLAITETGLQSEFAQMAGS